MSSLQQEFGDIDIYLFDQLLRGRIVPGMRVLDAGCGGGRNLAWLIRNGFDVYGSDWNAHAINDVRRLAASLRPELSDDTFRVEPLEGMSWPDQSVDVVICSAVLHFAKDDAHFMAMLEGAWRVLRPGGLFFSRLASSIGIESRVEHIAGRRYLLPDGSTRYLVDEAMLLSLTEGLGAELADPLKTTVVQNQRSMTTWVCRKQ